jgi:tRNA threonylcarbamoyladenosine biosynthesis protein TsaE
VTVAKPLYIVGVADETVIHQAHGSAETEQLGAELALRLEAGDVVLIEGELGAGKTTFVRGACRALGVTAIVSSPTFTIGQLYPGPVTVAHVDLYRIVDLAAEDPDLLGDYLRADTIAFVEWPQRAGDLHAEIAGSCTRVRIEHAGPDSRTIEIENAEDSP